MDKRQKAGTRSKAVRGALRRLAASHPAHGRPRIIGLGKFASGVPDLGSNKHISRNSAVQGLCFATPGSYSRWHFLALIDSHP